MGYKDYYVAALKGAIYKMVPDANLVDISHEIRSFNILEAAYCIGNVIFDFPDGTIHLIALNAYPNIDINFPSDQDEWPTVMQFKNQYFVGIDNGILSLILKDEAPQALVRIVDEISSPQKLRFPSKNVLANIACNLVLSQDLESMGEIVDRVKSVTDVLPVIDKDLIRGHVVHIDVYGNLITNITEQLFRRVGQDAPFIIYFKSKEYYIDKLHNNYGDVQPGERVAFFNSTQQLEIAINQGVFNNGGGANTLFGLKERDIVRIEFTPQGSRERLDELF